MTPPDPGPIPDLSRRRLLQAVAAAAVVLPVVRPGDAYAGVTIQRDTLEAWADTVVPGERRFPGDRVVLGAAPGPGAVQAGALALFRDPDVGLAAALPGLVALINAEATGYALTQGKRLDLRDPPFVALDFPSRTAVVERLVRGSGVVQLLWYAMVAMPLLAFHTAGHLDTAAAVRAGHPGLAWLGFPQPGPDGLWRFPEFSYGRPLARTHPSTTPTGHPA
jgi:hypothetical protein